MKKTSLICMLMALLAIGCHDPSEDIQVDQSETKSGKVNGFHYDGVYHSIPKNSTVDDELKNGSFTIARTFIMSENLYFFSTEEKLDSFLRSKFSAADLETIESLEAEDGEGREDHVPGIRQAFGGSGSRTKDLGEWGDFKMQWYNGPLMATTGNNLLRQYTMGFQGELGFIPDDIYFSSPPSGILFASLHADDDGDNCTSIFSCYDPTLIAVGYGDNTTVDNRVYGTFGSTSGKSMKWALNRVPHEELFIVKDGVLFTANRSTGDATTFLTGKSLVTFIASVSDYLYTIDNGNLVRINPYNGTETVLDNTWSGTEAFTAGKIGSAPHIFGVQGDHLWKTNVSNMSSASLGAGWGGTAAMTYGGGYIYAVHGDLLWKVNASNGATSSIDYGWTGVEALTFYNGYIYGVQGGVLWKVSTSGVSSSLGPGWSDTDALTSHGSFIYGIQGGYLWETNPSNGSTGSGLGSWSQTVTMTGVFQ